MFEAKSIAAKPLEPVPTSKSLGDGAEAVALAYLERQGLSLVTRNFKAPGRGGGEVDLIMRCTDGTLVFVEVRLRKSAAFGGAAASVSFTKQRRIIFAARHFLKRFAVYPPCRFDVVCLQGGGQALRVDWIQAAFDTN